MKLKRWLSIFFITLIICTALFAGFNALIDPFGIFGDKLYNNYSYNMTQNPRISKINYLDKNYQNYDSYIIGCSKTSSFPKTSLDKYYNAKFYNMIMYGGDLYDIEMTAKYIIENYTAKNIIVNIGLSELTKYNYGEEDVKETLHAKVMGSSELFFYGKYLLSNPSYAFDKITALSKKTYLPDENTVFVPETGAYDKSVRDVDPIGDLDSYLEKYPVFNEPLPHFENLEFVDECLNSIKNIKKICSDNNINFTMIISPMYYTELDMYYNEDMKRFFKELAEITPYWDFSGYHSISYDPRYFYDREHFRNCVGEMLLAKMFNDTDVYFPNDFGVFVDTSNIQNHIENYKRSYIKTDIEKNLPVLLYHNIAPSSENDVTISADVFENHIKTMKDHGYTAVTFNDIINYTKKGTPLPEKPVIITFDDGYKSNLDIAGPILEKYNMCAAINVIGVSVGKDTYKDTGKAMFPHFSFNDVKSYVEKGIFEIQSHSFDMHNSYGIDKDFRNGVYEKTGESEEDYIKAFKEDFQKSKNDIENSLNTKVTVYSYPFGKETLLSEVLLSEMDIDITLDGDAGKNTIVKGIPQSLRLLKRCEPSETTTASQLIDLLTKGE